MEYLCSHIFIQQTAISTEHASPLLIYLEIWLYEDVFTSNNDIMIMLLFFTHSFQNLLQLDTFIYQNRNITHKYTKQRISILNVSVSHNNC